MVFNTYSNVVERSLIYLKLITTQINKWRFNNRISLHILPVIEIK